MSSIVLSIPVDTFEPRFVLFQNSVKNMMIDNSDFVKIYYSDTSFVLNNIYLSFDLYVDCFVSQNKQIFYISKQNEHNEHNELMLSKLKSVEEQILQRIVSTSTIEKTQINSLHDQLIKGNIRIYPTQDTSTSTSTQKMFYYISNANSTESSYPITYHSKKQTFLIKISGVWITSHYFGITYKLLLTTSSFASLGVLKT
jgi:hypothetical protein